MCLIPIKSSISMQNWQSHCVCYFIADRFCSFGIYKTPNTVCPVNTLKSTSSHFFFYIGTVHLKWKWSLFAHPQIHRQKSNEPQGKMSHTLFLGNHTQNKALDTIFRNNPFIIYVVKESIWQMWFVWFIAKNVISPFPSQFCICDLEKTEIGMFFRHLWV